MSNQKVLTLDSQQLTSFQSCKRKYYYYFKENIELRPTKEPTGINKGAFIHTMFETYNGLRLEGTGHQEALQKTLFEAGRSDKLEVEVKVLLIRRFIEYFEYWKDDAYDLVASEEGFSKILYSDPEVLFIYEGRIDAVVYNKKEKRFIWRDYKSHSGHFIYDHNNQFLGYTWALGEGSRGEIDYFSTVKTPYPASKLFQRHLVEFTKEQVDLWVEDAIGIFWEIFKVEKYHRNLSQCQGKFGICQYSKLCERPKYIHDPIKRAYYQEKERWQAW